MPIGKKGRALPQPVLKSSPLPSALHSVTDEEAVAMSRHLNNQDGLFLGSSSACNLVASVRLAKKLPKGSTIVTILCVPPSPVIGQTSLTNAIDAMEGPDIKAR